MSELYSNAEDCNKMARFLYNELKNKIEFSGSIYQEVISGKYHCLPYDAYREYNEYEKDELSFSYKFCENSFLRISIGNVIYKNTIGHKLAALSDFYEVLSEFYGEPTLFYTIKDDDENTLNLQWSLLQKEEDIQIFKDKKVFDDAELDKVIVFGEEKGQSGNYRLSDTTRKIIARQIGLPFELIYLVDDNMEDFVKYKQGKIIKYTNESKKEGYPIVTFEDDKMLELQEQSGSSLTKKLKVLKK